MFVLNVDDDSDDREVFRDAVKAVDPNICCCQAESGISALQFLDQHNKLPGYIFIDINMPKMNGLECAQKIKSVPRFSTIPIIMYSTAFNPGDERYLSDLGIKCLTKKSRFSDLVNSLKTLLLNENPVSAE